jgi:Family of unknown function (DUF5522)
MNLSIKKNEQTSAKALIETVDYYYENGFMVMTEKFHLDRGVCCGNGCRHCPFDYENCVESVLMSKNLQ